MNDDQLIEQLRKHIGKTVNIQGETYEFKGTYNLTISESSEGEEAKTQHLALFENPDGKKRVTRPLKTAIHYFESKEE